MTDKKFREWISRQPSCLSGGFTEYVNGEGRNPACHVRRAANSGVAYKPEYSCIPLTDAEHKYQHQHGEAGLLNHYLTAHEWTTEDAKGWFDYQAKKYLRIWEGTHTHKPAKLQELQY